jgi:hypothetical protein
MGHNRTFISFATLRGDRWFRKNQDHRMAVFPALRSTASMTTTVVA